MRRYWKIVVMVTLFLPRVGHAQSSSSIQWDKKASTSEIKVISTEELFDHIRSALGKQLLNDTTTVIVKFSLRRGFGTITEISDYESQRGESYKKTIGPNFSFQNDKKRQGFAEEFVISVYDFRGQPLWQGGYTTEVNVKISITERVRKQILKRVEKACSKVKLLRNK